MSLQVDIFCGQSQEQWSPKSEQTGIGGSEEAVINIARELAKLGNRVTVWNRCGDDEGEYDGVKYENFEYFKKPSDVVIYWRNPEYAVKYGRAKKKTILWLHDAMPEFSILPAKYLVDDIFVLSTYHANLYPHLKDKLMVTSNGINLEHFNQKVKRNPKKIVYGSSYDRGLKELLEMWTEIKLAEPEAELTYFYGKNGLEKAGYTDFIEYIEELSNQEGVTCLDRINHKQVAKEFLSAGVWCYPSWFPEISCHPAGTRIMTQDGEIPIEKVGFTNVLTHTGRLKPITALMRKKAPKLLKFKVQSGDDLLCTSEHPIYVMRNGTRKFVRAKYVTTKDEIIFTKPIVPAPYTLDLTYKDRKNNLPTETKDLPDQYKITSKLAWWLGYFAGDGSASTRTGKISILVADKHPEHIKPVLDGFAELGLYPSKKELRGCAEYYVHSYKLARGLARDFYYNKSKKIPYGLLALPDTFNGLMAADGHCKNGHNYSFTNTSTRLIGYAKLALSLKGFTGKLQKRIHNNGRESYTLSWTEVRKFKFYHSDYKEIRRKIKQIKNIEHNDWVYNLEVESDNSFVANGHTVHNCITAMKAQAGGAIPVICPTAALTDTVRWGYTTREPRDEKGQLPWGTKMPDKLMDEFIRLTLKALKEDSQMFRNLMINDAKRFSWNKVATKWSKYFNG